MPDPAGALAAWKRALKPDGRLLVVDGLWYAGQEAPSDANIDDHLKDLSPLYRDTSFQAQLPLMLTESVVPMIQVIEAAGFDVLTLQRLLRVEDVDRRLRSEWYGQQPRYAIVARPRVGA